MKGQTNARAIISNAEKLYISLTTDLTDHSAIIGAVVTITYGSTSNSYTYDGNTISVEIPADVTYTITFDTVDGYDAPDPLSYTSQAFYSHNVSATYTKTQYKITTIRINQTLTDPSSMITRTVDGGGVEAIRANSHRYVGAVDDGVMLLMLLDDSDGTKFVDGTDASSYILGTTVMPFADSVVGETALTCDVFMKLPQFYYKCTQYATDQWDFTVSYGGKPDDTYKEWDGKDLIGVYEACNTSTSLYSVSGYPSIGSVTQTNFKTYARNRGDGFTLVKWKHHCMMGMLFYMYYGNTNCQAVCGFGTDSFTKVTGATDSLGMEDTIAGGNGDSQSINFWGLENWWGNKYEWIDNVESVSRVWTVTEDDGSTRTIGTQVDTDGYITKMLFGENIDLMPTAASGSSTIGFCDYNYYGTGTTVLMRSSSYAYVFGGVAFVYSYDSASDSYSSVGSRLAYRGDYEIVS